MKIIDAIIFFNEIDLLEIRLNELDSIVDHFVIVEALERHGSADKKDANLRDNWQVVKPFEHKIKYVILDRLEPEIGDLNNWRVTGNHWKREHYHRNCLMEPICELSTSPNDIVLISDADEIPRAEAIKTNLNDISTKLMSTKQDLFYYNVNNYICEWHGTVAGTMSKIKEIGGPQVARTQRDSIPLIDNAGWHFSYFGGVERMRAKVSSFGHAPEGLSQLFGLRSDTEIIQDVVDRRDLYHRDSESSSYRDTNDSRLPTYFLNHLEKFEHLTAEYFKKQHEGIWKQT